MNNLEERMNDEATSLALHACAKAGIPVVYGGGYTINGPIGDGDRIRTLQARSTSAVADWVFQQGVEPPGEFKILHDGLSEHPDLLASICEEMKYEPIYMNPITGEAVERP